MILNEDALTDAEYALEFLNQSVMLCGERVVVDYKRLEAGMQDLIWAWRVATTVDSMPAGSSLEHTGRDWVYRKGAGESCTGDSASAALSVC